MRNQNYNYLSSPEYLNANWLKRMWLHIKYRVFWNRSGEYPGAESGNPLAVQAQKSEYATEIQYIEVDGTVYPVHLWQDTQSTKLPDQIICKLIDNNTKNT